MKKKALPTLRVRALFRFNIGQTGSMHDPTLTTITITTTGLLLAVVKAVPSAQ